MKWTVPHSITPISNNLKLLKCTFTCRATLWLQIDSFHSFMIKSHRSRSFHTQSNNLSLHNNPQFLPYILLDNSTLPKTRSCLNHSIPTNINTSGIWKKINNLDLLSVSAVACVSTVTDISPADSTCCSYLRYTHGQYKLYVTPLMIITLDTDHLYSDLWST